MSDMLYLTWRHVVSNRVRIGLLVVLVTLAAALPLSLHLLLGNFRVGPGAHAHALAGNGSVLQAVITVVSVTSGLVVLLALAFGLRLRRADMSVLARIGCGSARLKALLALDAAFIGLASSVLVAVLMALVHAFSDPLRQLLFLG